METSKTTVITQKVIKATNGKRCLRVTNLNLKSMMFMRYNFETKYLISNNSYLISHAYHKII